ncbi:hypothetical protein Emag_002165 [Eimeria magna]
MQLSALTLTFLVAALLPLCKSSADPLDDHVDSQEELDDVVNGQPQPGPEGQEEATPTGTRVDCLSSINPYREAAGLTGFKQEDILPLPKNEATLSGDEEATVSSKFLASTARENSAPAEGEATYAVHTQTGTAASCPAAVEYWKGAVKNFDSLPPEYDSKEDIYNDRRNVSFVALFNPKPDATVDCVYVTCPKKAESGSDASGDVEDEFKKITDSLTNSASVAVSGALAFSAVSFGMLAA